MTKTYQPSAIANFFLQKAKEESLDLSQMQLIKLVYIAHGWNLALTNTPLIKEDIEAWKHGPVIPSLWYEFKRFGSNPITDFASEVDPDNFGSVHFPNVSTKDHQTYILLEKIWDVYKKFSAGQLRNMTHESNSPWSEVYSESTSNKPLNEESIKSHYKSLIQEMLRNE